ANNSETRTTVSAVDEWIPVSPIFRVEHLTQAIGTNRDVRRNQGANFFPLVAMNDAEVPIAITSHFMNCQISDSRQSWRFGGQARNEILHGLCRPLNLKVTPAL